MGLARHPYGPAPALVAVLLLIGTAGWTLEASTRIAAAISDRLATQDAEVRRLYEAHGSRPLWVDETGRPDADADEALALLSTASDDGLLPETYLQAALSRQAGALREAGDVPADAAAAFDIALSRSVLRYVTHLHVGRLDPRRLGFALVVPAESHDFAADVRAAVERRRVAQLREEFAPRLVQYQALRAALVRYRALAADSARLQPPSASTTVRPGERYPEIARLRDILNALGDLDGHAPARADASPDTGALYDGALVEGVRRFQARHGLEPDGIIGRATQQALRVPLAWRVRQLELALERLRWLPDFDTRRLVLVNIPMFHLWGWNAATPGTPPVVSMRAIVGRALDTETPVFVADMQQVVFRPYWNVPRSILVNEMLPRIARDPRYLDREALEIVRGGADDAVRVPLSADAVDGLRNGTLRLRQRPGPQNALGRVKFLFPNSNDVYMHDTPSQSLFSRARRDFSHGCVRVQDPLTLAAWALQDLPDWTRDRVEEAMAGAGGPEVVDLPQPVRVMLLYSTAAVTPRDGMVHFAPDIYRHDTRLDAALRGMPSPP
jgi:murein L,D-transpeptidase YcbB/YkuD